MLTPSPVAAEKRRVMFTKEQILAMPPDKRQRVIELLRQKAAMSDDKPSLVHASENKSALTPITPHVRTPQAWENYYCGLRIC